MQIASYKSSLFSLLINSRLFAADNWFSIVRETILFPEVAFVLVCPAICEMRIRNIYKSEELDEKETCAKIAQVQMEGERKVSRHFL